MRPSPSRSSFLVLDMNPVAPGYPPYCGRQVQTLHTAAGDITHVGGAVWRTCLKITIIRQNGVVSDK